MPIDLSALMGGKSESFSLTPVLDYDARAKSALVNGEVKLTVHEDFLTIAAIFDVVEIRFVEIEKIELSDYTVKIVTESGEIILSGMGSWCEPFYYTLCDAYGKKVLKAMFVKGDPIFAASGNYSYLENGARRGGGAPILLYENCVVILPPSCDARRVPLSFVTDINKGDYELTLNLGSEESYTFSKLGYDFAPFVDNIEQRIRKIRENVVKAINELDPSLLSIQASQIAKIMPEGAAAPFGGLFEISPSFVSAVETKINESRAASSYKTLAEIAGPSNICVGFKKNQPSGADKLGEILVADQYMMWMVSPGADGKTAIVEFIVAKDDSAATFVYSFPYGSFFSFVARLNRALEAIDLKREVIRLSDEELRNPDNVDYFMAAKRTASLQFVRSHFFTRIIHSSADSWEKKLLSLWQ